MAETLVRPLSDDGVPRKRFTRQEFLELLECGAIEERCELIDGEIINKMGYGWLHGYVIKMLEVWLSGIFGDLFVRGQMPLEISNNAGEFDAPLPDVVVTVQPMTAYRRIPNTGEALLVVEVADSSLRFDLGKKALRYARAGVRDYWVVDVNARRLHILRGPTPDGFATATVHEESETVALLLHPDASIRLSDLLPAPEAEQPTPDA